MRGTGRKFQQSDALPRNDIADIPLEPETQEIGDVAGRPAKLPPAKHRRWFGLIVGLASVVIAALLLAYYLPSGVRPASSFKIVAGSGHASFEPILRRFADEQGVDIDVTYKGSLDIMYLLDTGTVDFDAIWDADSLWTTMGDSHHLIKNRESIMRSPVVFGIKKLLAERLGWTKKDVSVQDILDAAGGLRLMMTSASQSNSGVSVYLGFLYAFAQPTSVLTSDDLKNDQVRASLKRILMTIDRTSESSGWLRDLFEKEYDRYDGMFNYESNIIELNQRLVASGREPLYIIYPNPGLGIADFPLSYVNHGDPAREAVFAALQKYLLSPTVQKELAAKGRRTGTVGITPQNADKAVFNPDWGVDLNRLIAPLRLPDTQVIREALDLYQTVLRKPSFTIYALDFSLSMSGKGEEQLKHAMAMLLDQDQARKYLLQGNADDITLVIPFDDHVREILALPNGVAGNDPTSLKGILRQVENTSAGGGTDIYLPVVSAMRVMKAKGIGDRLPAIILMTDGESNSSTTIDEVKRAIVETGLSNVPIYAITFGYADPTQLNALAALTGGRLFDGTKDLVTAFRRAKGNN